MKNPTNKTTVIATAENATLERNPSNTLAGYFEQYTNVTLADIAKATGANLTVMRSKAKEPVPGEVYDPEKINFKAVEEYLFKRQPSLALSSLDWETMNTPKEKTSRATVLDYTIGATYAIKRLKSDVNPDGTFFVVYFTDTHVALSPIPSEDTTLRAYSKDTFKAYSPVYIGNAVKMTNADGESIKRDDSSAAPQA